VAEGAVLAGLHRMSQPYVRVHYIGSMCMTYRRCVTGQLVAVFSGKSRIAPMLPLYEELVAYGHLGVYREV
jgi:hypothetical protein